MAIRIQADDRVSTPVGDEEIYLPGPLKGSAEEGPYEFEFPRVGRLIRLQRRLKGLNMAEAAAEEIDGLMQWLAKGFGPEAWELVRPDREPPVDRLGPGVRLADLRAAVHALERI